MTIKEKLDELKQSKNWNNEDLALKLDVSLNTVKSWNRKTNPNTPNKWITKEINKLFKPAGIDKILPTAKEVDDLLSQPDIYNKVADIIIDSGDIV